MQKNKEKNCFVFDDLASKESQFYFNLAIQFQAQNKNNCQVFSFLSSKENEGKSTTLVNLAYALSHKKKCLMIDLNCTSPSLNIFWSIINDLELKDFCANPLEFKSIIKNVKENLDLISFKKCDKHNILDLKNAFSQLINVLKKEYDYIFVDIDSTIHAVEYSFIDSFILCVRENIATKKDLKETMRIVNNYQLNLLFTLYIKDGF